MRLYIEIFNLLGDYAHGAITIVDTDPDLTPLTTIPISMPIQSYYDAQEVGLLQHDQGDWTDLDRGFIQSTLFLSPNELAGYQQPQPFQPTPEQDQAAMQELAAFLSEDKVIISHQTPGLEVRGKIKNEQ